MESPKYPRTPHLPYSPGCTNDDKIATITRVTGTTSETIITEKMDGSNVCLEHNACFARTHSGPPNHPSFAQFKQLHAGLKFQIPEGIQVFGEWLYARHSIAYSSLPNYLMIFGVRSFRTTHPNGEPYPEWASWDEVVQWSEKLSIPTVPILDRGLFGHKQLENRINELMKEPSVCGGEREGVVVRTADGFHDQFFENMVVKFVRANHVTTSEHWKSQEIVKNGLAR